MIAVSPHRSPGKHCKHVGRKWGADAERIPAFSRCCDSFSKRPTRDTEASRSFGEICKGIADEYPGNLKAWATPTSNRDWIPVKTDKSALRMHLSAERKSSGKWFKILSAVPQWAGSVEVLVSDTRAKELNERIVFSLEEWPYDRVALRERLQVLLRHAEEVGKLSLALLDGITVAEDLSATLRSFDTGGLNIDGGPMRDAVAGRMITVRRRAAIWGHILFRVDAALQIFQLSAPFHRIYSYMFIHECAHVHDLEARIKAITARVALEPQLSPPLFRCIEVSWNEYAACRLAAFSYPQQITEFKDSLRQSIANAGNARQRTTFAFQPTEQGRQNALTIALDLALPVLQSFSYLLGHCKALGLPIAKDLPENFDSLNSDCRYALRSTELELDKLWSGYGSWQSFDCFLALLGPICGFVEATTGIVMVPAPAGQMGVGLRKE